MLTSSPQSLNFLSVTRQHDAELTSYFEEWNQRFQSESDPNGLSSSLLLCIRCVHDVVTDSGCLFRCTLLPL